MTTPGIALVASDRLDLSRSPAAEIAAAALDAQNAAELGKADFIVIAVPPGELGTYEDKVRQAVGAKG